MKERHLNIEVLGHRGIWKTKGEQNTLHALSECFKYGCGIETDIRDCNSDIVISHDIPSGKEPLLSQLLETYKDSKSNNTLALNIKSDGLQEHVSDLFKKYEVDDFFLFDASIPDTLSSFKHKLRSYIRFSEYETCDILLDEAVGVWLDQFQSQWFNNGTIREFLEQNKNVCVVSSELHGRDHQQTWETIKEVEHIGTGRLQICTDFVLKAKEYFHD